MEKITDFCTGCRACEQVCPKKAITMDMDQEGFWFAHINQNICIDCGLCKKKCPQNIEFKSNANKPQVFVAKSCDKDILFKSASGGIFGTLAKAYIENGGIAFGVQYDSSWKAHHTKATNLTDLQPLLSSKYVQADTENTYSEVKHLLKEGIEVLYSGTGCQIAGLKSFLGNDYPNLVTIDIICHGVASPLLFQKYILWQEHKKNSPITFFDFRSKVVRWGLDFTLKTEKKTETKSCTIDPYFHHFLKGNSYRECCYHCHYSNPQRISDITIGDYWGVEKEHPAFKSKNGASVVLVNTEKGAKIWSKYANLFTVQNSSFEQAAKYNKNLRNATERNSYIRDEFYKGIQDGDSLWFDTVAKKFHPRMRSSIKAKMPLWLRKIMGR